MATIVLVRDLLFASRISGMARDVGAEIEAIRDPAKLAAAAGTRLIVDLNEPGALAAAIAWRKADANRQAIGFVSHVDVETIRQAREGGIDQVMPRSKFVNELAALLSSDGSA